MGTLVVMEVFLLPLLTTSKLMAALLVRLPTLTKVATLTPAVPRPSPRSPPAANTLSPRAPAFPSIPWTWLCMWALSPWLSKLTNSPSNFIEVASTQIQPAELALIMAFSLLAVDSWEVRTTGLSRIRGQVLGAMAGTSSCNVV